MVHCMFVAFKFPVIGSVCPDLHFVMSDNSKLVQTASWPFNLAAEDRTGMKSQHQHLPWAHVISKHSIRDLLLASHGSVLREIRSSTDRSSRGTVRALDNPANGTELDTLNLPVERYVHCRRRQRICIFSVPLCAHPSFYYCCRFGAPAMLSPTNLSLTRRAPAIEDQRPLPVKHPLILTHRT